MGRVPIGNTFYVNVCRMQNNPRSAAAVNPHCICIRRWVGRGREKGRLGEGTVADYCQRNRVGGLNDDEKIKNKNKQTFVCCAFCLRVEGIPCTAGRYILLLAYILKTIRLTKAPTPPPPPCI